MDVVILCGAAVESYTSALSTHFEYDLSILWTGHHQNETTMEKSERIVYDIDVFSFVSEQQRNSYCYTHNIPIEKTMLMPNGYSPCFRQKVDPSAKKKRLIYFSAPERGMKYFVDIWPKVLLAHPDASLTIYSSRGNYGVPDIKETIETKAILSSYKNTSINNSIGQGMLAEECKQAALFAYPCDFVETSCICLLEARAAGCKPVCSDIGVLSALLNDCVVYDGAFIDNFVKAVNNQLDKFTHEREVFNAESLATSEFIQHEFNYNKIVTSFVIEAHGLCFKKKASIARQAHFNTLSGTLQINIGESTPLFFKDRMSAATFYLKLGNAYFPTMWHHMSEKLYLMSYNAVRSAASARNLFAVYEKQKNVEKMIEWFYKCAIKESSADLVPRLKAAVSTNPSSLLPYAALFDK